MNQNWINFENVLDTDVCFSNQNHLLSGDRLKLTHVCVAMFKNSFRTSSGMAVLKLLVP
jgi:hypothetical protein